MAKKLRNYCKNCKFCIDHNLINTNKFCELEFKQNPVSEKATRNALLNNAILCSRNKFINSDFKDRGWSMAELLIAHPNSLNESLSKFNHLSVNFGLYLK